jgi:cell division protein FtsQ
MKNIKWKKIGILVLWITVASSVVFLLSFVNRAEKRNPGKSVNVTITNQDENLFISETDILKFLEDRNDKLIGEHYENIDIHGIEQALNTHPAIAKADVSIDIDGKVDIKITQRKPLVRIINAEGESYYIDNSARLMPLSENYAARVIVANGKIADKYSMYYEKEIKDIEADSALKANCVLDDIYNASAYIASDSLLSGLIQQIWINEQKEMEMYPAIGGHKIIFGTTEDLKEKFEKLKVFYKEGIGSIDSWNKYSVINLKYKNQVVCVKKQIPSGNKK